MKEIKPINHYLALIDQVWPDFEDDGLSCFPDWVYKYIVRRDISPAGRVHDWHYCSRCHRRGTMNQEHRKFADRALKKHLRELLPWWLRLTPRVVYRGVRLGGGAEAWNSCGPSQGERCRHNIQMPNWMKRLGEEDA